MRRLFAIMMAASILAACGPAPADPKRQIGARILPLRDNDGDGVADMQTVFIDHLHSPLGMVLVGSDFYVANTDVVMHYRYRDGQTAITAAGNQVTPLPCGPVDRQWTKSLAASPDGSKLYAGVSSNSNLTENSIEAETNRATIWEIDRITGARRLFATGLRNPSGLTFEPQSQALWAAINERDELGPDLAPDYMTSVKDGAFYRWPHSYYGQHVDPRVKPQPPDLVVKAIAPDHAPSSHVAPLGLVFHSGDALPTAYRGGAFVSEHGRWNRSRFNGYKVVFVPFRDGKSDGMAQDVLAGFIDGDTAHGRPVSLAVDKGRALLAADDVGDTIRRVTAASVQ